MEKLDESIDEDDDEYPMEKNDESVGDGEKGSFRWWKSTALEMRRREASGGGDPHGGHVMKRDDCSEHTTWLVVEAAVKLILNRSW